jgi:protein-disulfide isomerase
MAGEGVAMRFIFRNFPLSETHANAFAAAMAAEAAGHQGKFWEMHDYIFEHQDSLTRGHVPDMARAIGLDMDRYRTNMNAESIEQKVQGDFESGIRSGVNGTPSLYVNGKKSSGSITELASQSEKKLG